MKHSVMGQFIIKRASGTLKKLNYCSSLIGIPAFDSFPTAKLPLNPHSFLFKLLLWNLYIIKNMRFKQILLKLIFSMVFSDFFST